MELTLTALTTTIAEFTSNYGLWIGFIAVLAMLVASAMMAGRQVEHRRMTKLTKSQFQAMKRK